MAARENHGLQFALIVFVMLTIVLIVTTFMFFRKYEEAVIEKDKALAKSTESLKAQTVAQEETIALKRILGAGPRDAQKTIEDNFKEDMKAYAANFKEADQHYRQLVKYLHTELAGSDARFVVAKQREAELKAKIDADETAKKGEIAQYVANLDKFKADLTGERTSFNTSRDGFKKGAADLTKQVDAKRHEMDEAAKKANDEIQGLGVQVKKLADLVRQYSETIKEKEIVADLPRGKITWINQRTRTVMLNVGLADNLRRQITFKVLAADEPNMAGGKKKGSVEVVRLIDQHLAEAKILDDDITNPIMPGDQIYSQVWVPGRTEHFALVGFLDIDGDGESDRKRVRDLILQNGGVIDADVGDDGKRTGNVSVNTQYLVRGLPPNEKSAVHSPEYSKAFSDLLREAQTLNIKEITLDDLLNHMGYEPEVQTVAMDANAESKDFKIKPHGGVVRRSNTVQQTRKPVPRAGNSAYDDKTSRPPRVRE